MKHIMSIVLTFITCNCILPTAVHTFKYDKTSDKYKDFNYD